MAVKFVANSCNQCQTCLEGDEVFCDDAKTVGRTAPGSFQQYCYTYTSQLTRIPDNLDLPAAAPILCAGVTVWSALKKGNLQPGQWIAIPGAGGGLGSLAIQYARFRGLNVIAIDTGDEKKALCLKLGARVFVDFKKEQDLVVAIKAATPDGKGPQAALVTAAQIGAYHLAMAYIRRGGYVIGVGLPADGAVFQTDLLGTVAQRKNFVTSFIGNRLDAIEALQVAADGHVVAPIRVVPFDQLNATYEEMRQGKISGRVVLDRECVLGFANASLEVMWLYKSCTCSCLSVSLLQYHSSRTTRTRRGICRPYFSSPATWGLCTILVSMTTDRPHSRDTSLDRRTRR